METETETRVQKMKLEDVDSFVRKHEDPITTTREVAEEFNVTQKAARYRLKQLEQQERVKRKDIGASATAWYPIG